MRLYNRKFIFLGIGIGLLLGIPLVFSFASGEDSIDGRWKLVSRTDRDGNPISVPQFTEEYYTFDSSAGTMLHEAYCSGNLCSDLTRGYTVLGNGDLRFEGGGLSITMRASIVGDTLTLSRQDFSGSDGGPVPPPYTEGSPVPPDHVPPSGPPATMVLSRVQ